MSISRKHIEIIWVTQIDTNTHWLTMYTGCPFVKFSRCGVTNVQMIQISQTSLCVRSVERWCDLAYFGLSADAVALVFNCPFHIPFSLPLPMSRGLSFFLSYSLAGTFAHFNLSNFERVFCSQFTYIFFIFIRILAITVLVFSWHICIYDKRRASATKICSKFPIVYRVRSCALFGVHLAI